MSANLYDLLDVEETATSEEIRAAWKAAIADLDPTERRFRAYSDAAGVLLDEEKRSAYDAELAAEREAAEIEEDAQQPARDAPPSADEEDAATSEDEERTSRDPRPRRQGPSGGVLIAVGIAAVLAVGLVIWLLAARDVSAERDAITSAESAAEDLVAPVFSYNYKTMDADLERIRSHQTDEMAQKQAAGWPDLTKEAESQEVIVQASAVGTAVTRVSDDGRRAIVVVFIDQRVKKKSADPFTLRMWATLDLVRAGGQDDEWRIDDVCTESTCE